MKKLNMRLLDSQGNSEGFCNVQSVKTNGDIMKTENLKQQFNYLDCEKTRLQRLREIYKEDSMLNHFFHFLIKLQGRKYNKGL